MIIIEIESGSRAFHNLVAELSDPDTYRIRFALDEGEFKIKANEGCWTEGFEDGVTIKANKSADQLLRDLGRGYRSDGGLTWVNFLDSRTAHVAGGWRVTEYDGGDLVQVSNDRDGHEGDEFSDLESALAAINVELSVEDLEREAKRNA